MKGGFNLYSSIEPINCGTPLYAAFFPFQTKKSCRRQGETKIPEFTEKEHLMPDPAMKFH